MQNTIHVSARRNRAMIILAALLVFVSGAVGCGNSIKWYFDRNSAESDARRPEAPLFVYFRNWYAVECTRFEDNVLHNQDVVKATSDFVCVMLAYDLDKSVADDWGVTQAPGVAIVSPEGRSVAVRSGSVSADEMLKCIEEAKLALERKSTGTRERKPLNTPERKQPPVVP